jgi:hypothetical protein
VGILNVVFTWGVERGKVVLVHFDTLLIGGQHRVVGLTLQRVVVVCRLKKSAIHNFSNVKHFGI